VDDVVNDMELWGPLVFPESNPDRATLSHSRDVPRKLFSSTAQKSEYSGEEPLLPRVRMRQPSKKVRESLE
jgi:hypothetical protein